MDRDPLSEYIELARQHAEANDGTRAWVRRVNQAADRMRAIATVQLSGSGVQAHRFSSLVDSPDGRARLWAAHHLLELCTTLEDAVVARALAVIEAAAKGDSAEAMGEQMWLANWRRRGQSRPVCPSSQ